MSLVARFPTPCLIAILLGLAAGKAQASDRSLAISYGPVNQVLFALDLGRWGIYAQPIVDYSRNHGLSDSQYGGRGGVFFSYSAFTYRQLDCRLQAGAGIQTVYREESQESPYEPRQVIERTQTGVEGWIQPEFMFYRRFSLLLQAQVLRYTREDRESESESARFDFEKPDLSLGSLRIGLRYYIPLSRK